MKKLLLAIFALSASSLFAQKIKVNEYDKFLKARRVETSNVNIKQGLSCGIALSARAIDTSLFLKLQGYGCGCGVIGGDDVLMLLLDNQETVSLKSKGIQTYTVGPTNKIFNYEYHMLLGDLEKLKNNQVTAIRIYWGDYSDYSLSKSDKEALNKLFNLFSIAISKVPTPK